MSGAVTDFCTVTPKLVTSCGSCEAACVWRICVSIRSVFGSLFTSKFTIMVICPLPAVQRVHVVHVVDAAHLLLDGRGHGLLDGLRIGADVGRANLHFRRRDRRELRNGKLAIVIAPTITIRMEITIATMGD